MQKYMINSVCAGSLRRSLATNEDGLPIVESDNDLMVLINSVLSGQEANVLKVVLDEARRVGLGFRTVVCYEITTKAYTERAGLVYNENSFGELKEAVDNLFKNQVYYAKGKTSVSVRSRLISSMSTIAADECFEVRVTDEIVNLFNNQKDLKDSFSLNMISNQKKMSDEYSKVFYELLLNNHSYLEHKELSASIGEVYELIGYKPKRTPVELDGSKNVRFIFDRNEAMSIIEPIVANIKEHTELTISDFVITDQTITFYA